MVHLDVAVDALELGSAAALVAVGGVGAGGAVLARRVRARLGRAFAVPAVEAERAHALVVAANAGALRRLKREVKTWPILSSHAELTAINRPGSRAAMF